MMRSTVILAGGDSKRIGKDKGLITLVNKPLILHIIDKVSDLAEETIVVVSSKRQKTDYSTIIGEKPKIVLDKSDIQSPLVGARSGFESSHGDYTLLLPCDTPFISTRVLAFLFDSCLDRDASIPRWPNGYIEPLQAAYYTKSAQTAASKALEDKKYNMHSMIKSLNNVHYVSTSEIKMIDPELLSFFNINRPKDLRRAELTLKEEPRIRMV